MCYDKPNEVKDEMAAIIKQLDKRTGITYVYESVSYWDKEKKQSRAKRTLIGRLDNETGEIVKTDGRGKKQKEFQSNKGIKFTPEVKVQRLFYGATYLLDEIGKKIGIEKDLKACFPDTYKQILSLSYYLVLEPESTLYRFDKWHQLHKHPYGQNITSERSTSIFTSITEDAKNKFFKLQGKRRVEKEFWAYDTTSISSYSEALKQIQYGKNKENDDLPQLNLALVFGESSNLPFYYRKLPGGMSDAKAVKSLLAEFDVLGFPKAKLVMDRGFYSEKNINGLFKERVKFLIGVKNNLKFIRRELDGVRHKIRSFENYSEKHSLYAYTIRTNWEYKQEFPRKGKILEKRRLYIHFYFDIERAAEEEAKLDIKLSMLYQDLISEQRNPKQEKPYEKYFHIKTTPKRGTQAILKDDVVALEKQQFGYFALIGNVTLNAVEALDVYRTKDVIEKAFGNLKERLGMRRLRVSTEKSLEGKLFVQFIALIYLSFIKTKMKDTGLFKKFTLQKALDQLDLIESFGSLGHKMHVGELSEKQLNIFKAFDIQPQTSL
jgi:transposase